MSFEKWMRLVDAELVQKVGMNSEDLPDQNYSDMWEDGVAPKSAARRAIKNAKDE